MQRYFVPDENWQENTVMIQNDDAHHIQRVMRYRDGDRIICNHPDGNAAICRIVSIYSTEVCLQIEEWLNESMEMPVDVTIAQGIPKGDKFEYVLQKGTELGASTFLPVQSERSVAVWNGKKFEKKLGRFQKIVKEASEQSHRNKIPEVMPVHTTSEMAEYARAFDVKLFAFEEEAKRTASQSLGTVLGRLEKGKRILVYIGPEGGISKEEAAMLKEYDFTPIRLGPRILRTETASLYVLSSISYHLEELRCT
ncbi:16S rRNA (uracil(1498)-N(3))-methyltransferase [Virgibacillus siamensis]|uniref:16S rRNA (uracil(1498)-N(3))-methyltransferase n=1 Tax=Virgibacillus siamensis TaxID=480071 RepID=UPI0009853314|nr:16S rRNA (uracil(1498)-N(3))-methyltransferase [Virgibacillus siamensis]